jgi:hypothetical protein
VILMLFLAMIGIALVGQGLFIVADWRERRVRGASLSAERGEQIGRYVGAAFGVLVFIVVILWLEVGSQVFTAALVAAFAYMFCYAPIAGSAKGRASRVKAEREEAEQEKKRLQN